MAFRRLKEVLKGLRKPSQAEVERAEKAMMARLFKIAARNARNDAVEIEGTIGKPVLKAKKLDTAGFAEAILKYNESMTDRRNFATVLLREANRVATRHGLRTVGATPAQAKKVYAITLQMLERYSQKARYDAPASDVRLDSKLAEKRNEVWDALGKVKGTLFLMLHGKHFAHLSQYWLEKYETGILSTLKKK